MIRVNTSRRYQARRYRIVDLAFAITCGLASLTGGLILVWIVADLFRLGWSEISWKFLTGEVADSGRSGGIGPIIVSTLLLLLCCLGTAVPLGIGSAIWLSEYAGRGAARRLLTASVDVLASVPSIVFGLFGVAFFCVFLGLGFSILSGGLTLACMILPTILRTGLAALLALPGDLRPGAAALGLTRPATLFHLLLPRAFPGILVGFTIGTARALSETAALIFTSGYATRWPSSLGDSGRTVSVHIYDLAMNIPGGASRAAASALVLLLVLLAINSIASAISERWLSRSLALT